MPSTVSITSGAADDLVALGQRIRDHRKALRINATTLAEAAGISRVTLHRIEKGEPAVTMGAYLNVIAALGLKFGFAAPLGPSGSPQVPGREGGWLPARIRLDNYPQLAQLAWQVQGAEALSPQEAWDIYERNWRHVDAGALMEHERNLIDALRLVFGGDARHV